MNDMMSCRRQLLKQTQRDAALSVFVDDSFWSFFFVKFKEISPQEVKDGRLCSTPNVGDMFHNGMWQRFHNKTVCSAQIQLKATEDSEAETKHSVGGRSNDTKTNGPF
ncbi:hypothetical protein VZT92_013775 [Zoarces viviparus]|uniref:Uncharacterized protein n=1 Tax=Zoarces viviparus TaxID=48416 RepID=A0AAW1F5P3_ZOAVI